MTSAAAEPGRVLQDRYRLDAHIAAGGMGEVWQGTDLVLERTVAVKLLRPEHADDKELLLRFRGEAHNAGLLSHPNIAHVYDFRQATESDPAYLVMEFVDGPSLAGVLQEGPLDPARTMDIVAQAARGLAAAHRAGLVHRDVKPGNLLARHDGVIKVSDFGIARAQTATPVTRTGMLPGTPGYMAPERASGAVATPAGDLYSLGIVAYQCLTGRPPYEGDALAVAIAHIERDLPGLPETVPAEVAVLVADLTSKDPQARPSSAEDVAARAERLRAVASGLPAAAPALPAVAAQTTPDLPTPDPPGGQPASLLRPRTWPILLAPGGQRIWRSEPARRIAAVLRTRAALTVLVIAGIAAAGVTGWLLGTSGPAPAPQRPQAPPAASQHPPGGQATVGPPAAPAATPAVAPSPSASVTPSPTVSPSATPTASPTPSASPSSPASPTATPTPSANPTPGPGQGGAGTAAERVRQ